MDKPPVFRRRAYTIGFHRYWISLIHPFLTIAFESSSTSRRRFFISALRTRPQRARVRAEAVTWASGTCRGSAHTRGPGL